MHKRKSFIEGGDIKKRLKKISLKYRLDLRLIAKAVTLLFSLFVIYTIVSKTISESTDSTKTPTENQTDLVAPIPSLQPISPKAVLHPSQVLDLNNWKVTLPIGSSEKPKEIKQPEIVTYSINPWFMVAPEGTAVIFRAAVNGVTTSGSDYPRSELREMTANGRANAEWSSSKGTHTMFLDQAITAVPKIKRHVVAGQIHDDNKEALARQGVTAMFDLPPQGTQIVPFPIQTIPPKKPEEST